MFWFHFFRGEVIVRVVPDQTVFFVEYLLFKGSFSSCEQTKYLMIKVKQSQLSCLDKHSFKICIKGLYFRIIFPSYLHIKFVSIYNNIISFKTVHIKYFVKFECLIDWHWARDVLKINISLENTFKNMISFFFTFIETNLHKILDFFTKHAELIFDRYFCVSPLETCFW